MCCGVEECVRVKSFQLQDVCGGSGRQPVLDNSKTRKHGKIAENRTTGTKSARSFHKSVPNEKNNLLRCALDLGSLREVLSGCTYVPLHMYQLAQSPTFTVENLVRSGQENLGQTCTCSRFNRDFLENLINLEVQLRGLNEG